MDILVLVKCPFSYSNFIKSNILIFLWWKNSKFKINFSINVMISVSVTWLMWKQCENYQFLFKFFVIQKKEFFQSKNQKEKKLLIFPFSLFLCVCIVVGFSFKKVLNKNICVLTSEDKDLRMHAKKKNILCTIRGQWTE